MKKTTLVLMALMLLAAGAALAAEPAPVERFAQMGGMRLHYQDWGKGDDAIVLVHGWSCNLDVWRFQARSLARRWRVIAVDLPGHGQSDKPKAAYTMDLLAKGLGAIIKHAGAMRVVLVGHSMGYPVCRKYCLAHPDAVAGLVIVDGAYMQAPRNDEERKQYQAMTQGVLASFQGPDYAAAMAAFLEPMMDPATPQAVRDEALAMMLATPRYVAYSALADFVDEKNWGPLSLPQPTLAVFAQSPDSPPDQEAQLRAMHPDLQFVLWKGVSHFFMLERPDELSASITGFADYCGLHPAVR